MEGYKPCVKCGLNYSERHHIIYKSSAKYMEFIPINIIYLCREHHRGNHSPHKNDKINKQYKLDFQRKLESLFIKSNYNELEISEILEVNIKEVMRIVKTLKYYEEGYRTRELIKRCLGGMFYD